MSKNKILIVDDHGVVIEGIRSRFQDQEEFEVVGEAFNGRQALELVESLRPEVVIMDISMPELNGVEATKQIKQLFPETSIVIYTMFEREEYVIELFKAGISGDDENQSPLAEISSGTESPNSTSCRATTSGHSSRVSASLKPNTFNNESLSSCAEFKVVFV